MSEYRKDFREFQRDYYWTFPRMLVMGMLAVASLGGVGFGLRYFGYLQFSFFAPRYEAVRRDQMIESRSYTEGTIRELYTLRHQYQTTANDQERATIAAAARHEFSIFPKERLPADLQSFLQEIGG